MVQTAWEKIRTLSPKQPEQKGLNIWVKLLEYLPSKCKALSSNSTAAKKSALIYIIFFVPHKNLMRKVGQVLFSF
jgi:hypothetical protein